MKSNKLIAEFMGVNIITIDDVRKNKNPYISSADGYLEDDLEYHKSWAWLMPVVEKIMWDNDIDDDECTNIADALCDAKFDRVYNAVIEFINKYNN